MADKNVSAHTPQTRAEMFKWHGAELIVISAMMACGILGNLLVLYITHCRWKSNIFNFFIKVLAWLDMSSLVIALPMLLVITVNDRSPIMGEACQCTSFVALFSAIASACVLVVIAANRYRKLCHPQRSQVTLLLAKKLCIGCLIIGIVLSIPTLWIFKLESVLYMGDKHPVNISHCFIKRHGDPTVLISWAVVTGLTFVVVTSSLVVFYGFTIRALKLHDERVASMMRRPSTVSGHSASKSVARKHTFVFILVTVVFFASYSPYFVTVILSLLNKTGEDSMSAVGKAFLDIAKLFPLFSNVSNPIIYSFTSEKFRLECKKVLKLRPCRRMLSLSRKDSTTVSHELSQSEEA